MLILSIIINSLLMLYVISVKNEIKQMEKNKKIHAEVAMDLLEYELRKRNVKSYLSNRQEFTVEQKESIEILRGVGILIYYIMDKNTKDSVKYFGLANWEKYPKYKKYHF
uniref:Uncharacterized protein n=2 Tax=Carnobacterium maltaromaticum TaxID=2751 RepID=A0A1Z5AX95_CARML|nr:protein of unknown function [Carnobacterium maltaromaticum]